MAYSKAGPDDFVPELRRLDAPPPVSSTLAWLVALAALATMGLCLGWFLATVVW